jgi:hypothetical protein
VPPTQQERIAAGRAMGGGTRAETNFQKSVPNYTYCIDALLLAMGGGTMTETNFREYSKVSALS